MLSLLMAGALSGLLGGVHNRDLSIDTPAAAMRVHAPAVLRNGEFFEFRVQITARRDIAEPVIAISAPYWRDVNRGRSEEHTSELQSLMRISYAVFCLKKKK